MIVATTETIAGHEIAQTIGIVRGSTVRTKHVGTDIAAGLKTIVGGEVHGYSSLMAGAREQAIDRMIEDAARYGADAIVSTRFETSALMGGAAELLAYGTAVKLK